MGSQPEALITAGGRVRAAVSDVDVQIASGRGHMADLDTKWTGTAAQGAQTNAEEMIGDQVLYREKLTALQTALNRYGENLRDARSELEGLVNSGEADMFYISDDGTVAPGLRLLWYASLSPVHAMEVNIRRLKLQTAIQTALDRFDAADKAAAAAIRTADRS